MDDLRLLEPAESLPFHSALNRTPLSVPISFAPAARLGTR